MSNQEDARCNIGIGELRSCGRNTRTIISMNLLHLRWNVSHTPIPPRFLHMQKLADRVIAIAELLDEVGERPKAVLFVHFVAQDIF